jgi:hypothetical protein
MGLLRKFFRDKENPEAPGHSSPASSQFHESETTQHGSRNAPRRELVQVVLRDTMRMHGIPSDWIECRILSVVSRSSVSGVHVTFIIRDGEDRLLGFVHPFQDSFVRELEKYEPRAKDWLFSVSWQFDGKGRATPDAKAWSMPQASASAPAALADADDEVAEDLKALFAIRDAALRPPAEPPPSHVDFEPTRPGEAGEDPPR